MSTEVARLETTPRDLQTILELKRGVRYRFGLQIKMFPDDVSESAFLNASDQEQAQALLAALQQFDAGGGSTAAPVPPMPMPQAPVAQQMAAPMAQQMMGSPMGGQPAMGPPQMPQAPMGPPQPMQMAAPAMGMPQPPMGQPMMAPPSFGAPVAPPMGPPPQAAPQMAPPAIPQAPMMAPPAMGQPMMGGMPAPAGPPVQPAFAPPPQAMAMPQQPQMAPPRPPGPPPGPPMAQPPMGQPMMAPPGFQPAPTPPQAPAAQGVPQRQPSTQSDPTNAGSHVSGTMIESLKTVSDATRKTLEILQEVRELHLGTSRLQTAVLKLLIALAEQQNIDYAALTKVSRQVDDDKVRQFVNAVNNAEGKG